MKRKQRLVLTDSDGTLSTSQAPPCSLTGAMSATRVTEEQQGDSATKPGHLKSLMIVGNWMQLCPEWPTLSSGNANDSNLESIP